MSESETEPERVAAVEAKREEAERDLNAAEEAKKNQELALLTPPPEEDIAITNADIQDDANLEKALVKFLNKEKALSIWTGPQMTPGEVESIDEVQLLSVSGSELKIDVRVTWQESSYKLMKHKRYVATVELYSGDNYTVWSVVER